MGDEVGPDVETVTERVTPSPDDERGRPRTREIATGTDPGAQKSASSRLAFGTPEDALRQAEIDNIRKAGIFFCALAAGAIVVVHFFIDGHPVLQPIYITVLASFFVIHQWIIYLTRRPELYVEERLLLPWFMLSLAAAVNQLYWGAFSGGIVVSVLALSVVGPSFSIRLGLIFYGATAISHMVGAIAVIAGFEDVGVVTGDELPVQTQVVITLLLQGVLVLAFLFARATRRSAVKHITELHEAVRVLGQREAVLAEARDDLKRALGLYGEGVFSGHTFGNYKLDVVIGRGAMGEIYEGIHITSGELAAVKVLRRSSMGTRDLVQRFVREIETMSKIEDEHVVKVLEVGLNEVPIPYIALERLEGESLKEILRREVRMSVRQLVVMVNQVASGISAAHAVNVVHRDIKPQNLFRAVHGDEQTWKVLDFGISKLVGEGSALTEDRIVGTPQYMSPEQARRESIDMRTDVYGLAAVAYRALTGHAPYARGALHAVIHDVIYSMPIEPKHLADVPDQVDMVLRIGLAKDLGDRFPTVAAFARALTSAADDRLTPAIIAKASELQSRRPWSQIRHLSDE